MPPKQISIDIEVELTTFERNSRLIRNFITNLEKLGAAAQTAAVLNGRLKLLNTYWTNCQQASSCIELWATEDERKHLPYFKNLLADQVEDSFLLTFDYINEKLSLLRGDDSSRQSTSGNTNNNVSPHKIKLSVIKIQTFSGAVTEWIKFRQIFTSLVIENPELTNVQRLHYLIAHVSEEAAKLIAHITLSDANFNIAWQLLVQQYENRRSIIDAHFNQFFSIPSVGSDTLAGLKILHSSYTESLNALRALDRDVDHWNDIVVYYLVQKLDKDSREFWESQLEDETTYPTLELFSKIINKRIRTLTALESSLSQDNQAENKKNNKSNNNKTLRVHHNQSTAKIICPLCKSDHKLMQCEKFKISNISERQNFVKKNNICFNCLCRGHSVEKCKSKFTCSQCKRKHHTLLHRSGSFPNTTNTSDSSDNPSPTRSKNENNSESSPLELTSNHGNLKNKSTLLATAWVQIESTEGRKVKVRALIDQCSDTTFISENLSQSLKLKREKSFARVSGLGGKVTSNLTTIASFKLSPISQSEKGLWCQAFVIPKITNYSPSQFNINQSMMFFKDLTLADPNPTSTITIDLLIGADLYSSIILDGVKKGAKNDLVAQNTIFGWILSGPISSSSDSYGTIHAHHCNYQELKFDLQKFWEIEELPPQVFKSSEDIKCEEHFVSTHYRVPSGRYGVRLPFKEGPPIDIGESKSKALGSFLQLEKQFENSIELRTQYSTFMMDYENSGHMSIARNIRQFNQVVFLPHHAVIRLDHQTTKLRVVFNASSKTKNNTSLNDHLL